MTSAFLEGVRTRLPVVLAVLAGLGLSGLASYLTFQWEREQQLEVFSRNAEQRLEVLRKSLDDALEQVMVVADFIRAHEPLEEETFRRFTALMPARHSFIQAIFWVPRLTHAQQGALENAQKTAPRIAAGKAPGKAPENPAHPAAPPLRPRARKADGSLGPAPIRAEYFPVRFVQPGKGNAALSGLDLGSIPSRLKAIRAARDSGKIVISERLKLSRGGMAGFGFLALAPIYSTGAAPATRGKRRELLIGFAGITFRIFPLVHQAIPSLGKADSNFEVAVFDKSAPPGKELLYGENAPVLDFESLASYPQSSAGTIPIGGRKWLVVFFPSPSFLEAGISLKFLAVFLAGLLLTGFAGVFLARQESRRYRIQDEVLRITGELADAMFEIRNKEERHRSLVEAAPLVLMAVDANGRITVIEGRALEGMELGEKAVVGSPIEQLREALPTLVEGFISAMAGETLTREIEISGKFFETRFSPAIVKDARREGASGGRVGGGRAGDNFTATGGIAVAVEVTQAKMFKKLRTDFISAMFHEVRTPLTSIVGYSDILLEDDVGELNAEQQEFIEIISSNAARLNDLINNLAVVERLEGGHGHEDFQEVDLSAVLARVAASHARLMNQKSLTFKLDVPDKLTLRGNPARIFQIFHQLLSTSIKLTAEGWVRLTARREPGSVVVEVSDNGSGMDTSALDSLFYDYFRVDERVIRATGGTGLGLAIAREIIMAHKGALEVESEPGKGSTFTVTFPADPDSC